MLALEFIRKNPAVVKRAAELKGEPAPVDEILRLDEQWRAHLHRAEATKAEQGDPKGAWSDRLLDALCLVGPLGHCRERLAAYREAGVGLPILYPSIGVEAARATINAFRQ